MTRIDVIFAIQRTINGSTPAERQAVRDQTIRPLVGEFVAWLNEQRRALSPKSETAKAMDYGLKRMPAFTRFLDDGPICLSNNAAERAMRCVALLGSSDRVAKPPFGKVTWIEVTFSV